MSTAGIVLTPDLHAALYKQICAAQPCPKCDADPYLVIRGNWVGVSVWHTDRCPDCPRPLPVGEVLAHAQGPVTSPQT